MPVIPDPSKLCTDFLRYMASQKSASPHTLRAYSRDLADALSLGKVHYESLDFLVLGEVPKSFELFSQAPREANLELPKTGSLSSKNRHIATLKSFFRWAFDSKRIPQDYGLRLVCPKRPQRVPHFISVDEALAVLASYQKVQNPQEKLLFLLLYGGGLRVSEACQLKQKDILWRQRQILILGKGNKERLMTLPDPAWDYLKQLSSSMGEYVFGEKPLSTRKAYDWIKAAGVRADLIRPLHPHALRHSFATHLLSDGVNLRILQSLLGHESLTATEKYTHLSIDQLARTMEKLHPLGEKIETEVDDA